MKNIGWNRFCLPLDLATAVLANLIVEGVVMAEDLATARSVPVASEVDMLRRGYLMRAPIE